MWELDHKEGWVPKNWCFQIVVLEKTLENPLDCKEIKPVNTYGNQPWIFIGRTDADAEALILWLLSFFMFSSVQSLSHVRLFVIPWTAARQASLSITNSQSSLKLMSIESVMPSSHLILCRPLLLLPPIPPCIRVFFQWVNSSHALAKVLEFSALASFLPKNTQDWSPSEWTGWISLQSKGLSRVFSNTTVQKHQFFCTLLSL